MMELNKYNGKSFVLSFSGGKDSTLALYRCIKAGMKPAALLTTLEEKGGRSQFHGISGKLLDALSASLNIPIIKLCCTSVSYAEQFAAALKACKENGAELVVYGDIDIEDHLKWGKERAAEAGLEPLYPLWQENREALALEFIDSGFKAYIKLVNLSFLDDSFLGRVLDRQAIADIKSAGADPCGENGEYHTIVFDGPIFNQPLQMAFGEKGKLSYSKEFNYAYIDME